MVSDCCKWTVDDSLAVDWNWNTWQREVALREMDAIWTGKGRGETRTQDNSNTR